MILLTIAEILFMKDKKSQRDNFSLSPYLTPSDTVIYLADAAESKIDVGKSSSHGIDDSALANTYLL